MIANGVPATADNFNAAFADYDAFYFAYSAIVGSASGCTHATLAAAIADVNVTTGSRILITDNYTVNTSAISISKANMQIDFLPGVTYTSGTSATGISIDAAGTRIRGARFSGFTTAISIAATFNYNFITECRFASCTTDIDPLDPTPNNFLMGNITE